jgi:hypothetical protein
MSNPIEFDNEEQMKSAPLTEIWGDTDDITIEEYGNDHLIRSYAYPKIEFSSKLNPDENYNPLKIFFMKTKHFTLSLFYSFKKMARNIKSNAQRFVRKSHMSDIDTYEFCITTSRFLLPKLLQYKKLCYENLYETSNFEVADNLGRAPVTKHEVNEMIYALEWILDTSPHTYTKRQDDFYIKYYGKTPYHPHKIGEFKHDLDERDDNVMVHEARKRAQKGFELLGYHFTHLGGPL